MCGATTAEKNNTASTATAYTAATNQAAAIFGNDQTAYNDLMSSFAPTIAAGPSQYGFSNQEDSNMRSQAITQVGQEAKNEKAAVGNAESTQVGANGGGPVGAGGATVGADLSLAENAGNKTADELAGITSAGYEQGNKNYTNAVSGLTNAPSVFNSATGATSAETGAGGLAEKSAADTAASAQSPWQIAASALGGVAGAALGGGSFGKIIAGGNSTNAPVSLSEYNNSPWTPGSNTTTPQNA